MWNVLVHWEDGSQTYEPLSTIAADCPVICAQYAKLHGLLNTPGWKRFKSLAKKESKMIRQLNQAKLQSHRRAVIYQFGYRIPRDAQEAIALDKINGNTRWQDAI